MIRIPAIDRSTLLLIAAFAAVYLIWGSTYLAIRIAIDSMPPLVMVGSRFVVAGVLVLAWLWIRGSRLPEAKRILHGAFVGILTVGLGTGAVAWAEQYIPSGLAALLVTTVPIWMVLLEWKWKRGARPTGRVAAGLVFGLAGVAVLVDPRGLMQSFDGSGLAIVAVLLGSVSWSIGSLYGRGAVLPRDPFMNTGIQMTSGGLFLGVLGFLRGELRGLDASSFSSEAWIAWVYLIVFGSIIAFGAYVWLLDRATAGQVSTYAFVNPVVAVFLGWLVVGEPITWRVGVSIAMLVGAVLLITRAGK
ncbi:MAG: EamA family transporter, partial [Rhodothermales bacterium]|nr:EamA family transporter [Rhodothermales bacterium]